MMLCPMCGASSPKTCELMEEAGCCPWEESGQYDTDAEREKRDDDARYFKQEGWK